jgi:hypothetical protein
MRSCRSIRTKPAYQGAELFCGGPGIRIDENDKFCGRVLSAEIGRPSIALATAVNVTDGWPRSSKVPDAIRIARVVNNSDREVTGPRGQQVCNVVTTAVADHDDLNISTNSFGCLLSCGLQRG